MKVFSVLALTLASASAFVPASPAFARTSAMQVSKEEDLELTRKVIHDFQAMQDGEAPVEAEEKKEPVAAAAEE
eukprot:CAMPEP_0172442244 /NCGR_PEP_ID=MMETSP1065-20121228/2712_1 /TAXON_ID=265537 /ORGANISM="Amphiprora paludosa, Strain CCMP125" /LENGTH=73 /DNA_ID=CAMNT_0013192037 /DNA_START=74 /DNA_END=295 /DNA_ORIENTATION=-